MAEGIVGGQGFAVDASMIRADAHRQKGVTSREELDPENTNRAVTEYLAVLDDAAFGAATEVAPKFISPTDPAARWTAAAGGPACYAYCDNYLIDVEHWRWADAVPLVTGISTDQGDRAVDEPVDRLCPAAASRPGPGWRGARGLRRIVRLLAAGGWLLAFPATAEPLIPRAELPGLGQGTTRRTVDATAALWRSLVRVQTELGQRCTGALIAPDQVLTAAHCITAPRRDQLVQPGSVHFLLGWPHCRSVSWLNRKRKYSHTAWLIIGREFIHGKAEQAVRAVISTAPCIKP